VGWALGTLLMLVIIEIVLSKKYKRSHSLKENDNNNHEYIKIEERYMTIERLAVMCVIITLVAIGMMYWAFKHLIILLYPREPDEALMIDEYELFATNCWPILFMESVPYLHDLIRQNLTVVKHIFESNRYKTNNLFSKVVSVRFHFEDSYANTFTSKLYLHDGSTQSGEDIIDTIKSDLGLSSIIASLWIVTSVCITFTVLTPKKESQTIDIIFLIDRAGQINPASNIVIKGL